MRTAQKTFPKHFRTWFKRAFSTAAEIIISYRAIVNSKILILTYISQGVDMIAFIIAVLANF